MYFALTGKKFRGNQGGRSGGGRGRGKRRSFDRQQNKPGQEKDDETQKATHTRFDDGEPAEKKVKTEEDWCVGGDFFFTGIEIYLCFYR